jgi:hypothetical protein
VIRPYVRKAHERVADYTSKWIASKSLTIQGVNPESVLAADPQQAMQAPGRAPNSNHEDIPQLNISRFDRPPRAAARGH